ncbi:prepilin-type N-terminal cleavage/methylation domain-containing protein [Cupriavidus necator]|uniref:Prepilin-type N-terminal cleavage/methylation domain-containing protein n=1 Tax=Cupriavidus necator TaxID=106590 RepID=A0A367PMB6_CUPNE|nr:prepilin-type N-terminal cleavage/methylation domain-containing protein [Cupriavidus necator]QQX84214.1 prepilin-type N-terminal cleavage/methylation domain-containing protein [Cupriavidus necator]RCJ08713.1 prepilin-type N-terminal cleavage/methylation domain-containing protein [Cupriavidus necator]
MKPATCSERRRPRRPGGFTLLEMLVAITLLAVMAVIGWRALDSMTRSRERLTDHDARLDALKVLYGQLQADCEHLANPTLLQASPVEIGQNRLLLVRDRRDEGQPPTWQALSYQLDGNTLVRVAAPPVNSRAGLQSALLALRQGGGNTAQVRRVLADVDGMSMRAWVEPAGWQADSGRIRNVLFAGNAASTVAASAPGAALPNTAVRAVELTIFARMGDGDAPRQFQKICMTGL